MSNKKIDVYRDNVEGDETHAWDFLTSTIKAHDLNTFMTFRWYKERKLGLVTSLRRSRLVGKLSGVVFRIDAK